MKVENMSLTDELIKNLQFMHETEVHSMLLDNMLKMNGFFIDQLNRDPAENRKYIDCLQSLNILMKFVQSVTPTD